MVCCAFAIFILGQLVAAWAWAGGRLGFRFRRRDAPNLAVSWRLDIVENATTNVASSRFRRLSTTWIPVLLLSFAALVVAAYSVGAQPEDHLAHIRALLNDRPNADGMALHEEGVTGWRDRKGQHRSPVAP